MFIDGPVDPPLTRADADPTRAPVRWAAIICGMFFLAIGFAGFFPGMTMNFNAIEMGYGSEAMVLGIFQVSVLHNVIHLLLGAAALAQSRFSYSARRYLRVAGGFTALLLAIPGVLLRANAPDSQALSDGQVKAAFLYNFAKFVRWTNAVE